MKNFFLSLIFVTSLPLFGSDSQVKLLGDFIFANKNDQKNTLKEDLYFTFKHQKEERLAYPVITKNQEQLEYIKKNKGKIFFIYAKTVSKKRRFNEMLSDITYLEIDEVRTVELKDIKSQGYDPKGIEVSKDVRVMDPRKNELITIDGVNDKVTNSLIFTGAAFLLGRMLIP